MSTILQSLKQYFQNNSQIKIHEDWNEFKEFDKVGPKVEEFICKDEELFDNKLIETYWNYSCFNKKVDNPKFDSEFFFNLAS